MAEHNILTKYDRVELLEGHLVQRHTATPLYSNTVTQCIDAFRTSPPDNRRLRPGKPLVLSVSVPQPDFAVARGDDSEFRGRHPAAADVALALEVTDAHVEIERLDMARIYARANLPVYWVINLVDRQVEVYADPRPADPVPSYPVRTDYRVGDSVPLVLDGRVIAHIPVADLLG